MSQPSHRRSLLVRRLVFLLLLAALLAACATPGPGGPSPGAGGSAASAASPTAAATLPIAQSDMTGGAQAGGRCAVLFDNSKAETAGNADWIISTSQPDPLREHPNPQRESDWTGSLSSWGVALHRAGGYQLLTLPDGRTISYGAGGELDLAGFDVFIVPEPNIRFSPAEKRAIVEFVRAGGGLFMIADHTRSDRNNDGWDSPAIWNDLIDDNGVEANLFGIRFDLADVQREDPKNLNPDPGDPIVHGPFGEVRGSIIRSGTTATLDPARNPAARGVIWRNGATAGGNQGVFVARSEYGAGRVVALGDSSPIEDETAQPRNRVFDGWNDPAGTNAALALNATAWLCGAPGAPIATATPCPFCEPGTAAPIDTAPTPAATSCPAVPNGSFDGGDLSQWRNPGGGKAEIVSSPVHAGAGALSVTHENTRDRGGAQGVEFDLPGVQGGGQYTLQGWMLRDDPNVEMVRVRFAWYSCTDYDCRANNLDVELPAAGGDWQQVRATATAPQNAVAARVRLQFYGNSRQPTTIYFDDLSLACGAP